MTATAGEPKEFGALIGWLVLCFAAAAVGGIEAPGLADHGKAERTVTGATKPSKVESGKLGRPELGRPFVIVTWTGFVAKVGMDGLASTTRIEREVDQPHRRCGASRRHTDEGKEQRTDKGEKAVHDLSPLQSVGQSSPVRPRRAL